MVVEVKLVIETEQLSAAEVAKILGDLDKAFKGFVGRRGGRAFKAELTVSAVRSGSIEIVLDAIDSVGKLIQAGQFLAPFATHLAQLVQLALGMQIHKLGSEVTAADRKAIGSLAAPVANGHATQINIVNNGNIVLNIGSAAAAKAILDGLQVPKPGSDLIPLMAVDRQAISSQQVAQLEQGKLMGSTFLVDETWYARLAGGQGTLVPISGSDKATGSLRHGKTFTFRGSPLHGTKGETIGIVIDDAQQVTGKPKG